MAFFNWDERYRVGVQRFDEQHQRLFALVDGFHQAMKEGKARKQIDQMLQELVEYTVTHFAEEERNMRQYKYPKYLTHKAEHDQFTNTVKNYQSDYLQGTGNVTTVDIMELVKSWLLAHVLGSDQEYGPFFNGLGVK